MDEQLRWKVAVNRAMRPSDLQELLLDYGMLFSDVSGREQFFSRADANPLSVPFGAALSHARSTNLGAWGNVESLYADCAKIMSYELTGIEFRSAERTRPSRVTANSLIGALFDEQSYSLTSQRDSAYAPSSPIRECEVTQSATFRRLFELQRAPKEAALHNFVRGLGNNDQHMHAMSFRDPDAVTADDYFHMISEIYVARRY